MNRIQACLNSTFICLSYSQLFNGCPTNPSNGPTNIIGNSSSHYSLNTSANSQTSQTSNTNIAGHPTNNAVQTLIQPLSIVSSTGELQYKNILNGYNNNKLSSISTSTSTGNSHNHNQPHKFTHSTPNKTEQRMNASFLNNNNNNNNNNNQQHHHHQHQLLTINGNINTNNNSNSNSNNQSQINKMSGGVRRTVSSSAAAHTSSGSSANGGGGGGSSGSVVIRSGGSVNNNNNTTNQNTSTTSTTTTNCSKVNTQCSLTNNISGNGSVNSGVGGGAGGGGKNGSIHHNNHVNNNNNNNSTNTNNNNNNNNKSADSHKKLDRSYSEPAEKNKQNGNTAAINSALQLNTSSRYKTELCRSFAEVGHCKYGDKCQFAHGDEELRTITRHPKFKTENCKSFHSTGFCPYGPRCHFIHNSEESKKSLLNHLPVGTNPPLFDPLPIGTLVGLNGNHHPTLVSSQSNGMPTLPSIQSRLPFGGNGNNLVRPKALSLGSYSLGSSGEISSPSSQSGSPTSLNSFFCEDTAFAIGNAFGTSRISANFPSANSNTFSFSPDSAFVAFNPNNNINHNSNISNGIFSNGNGNCQHISKGSIFGGCSTGSIHSNFSSPEPTIADQTTNSVISTLFGSSSCSPILFSDSFMSASVNNGKSINNGSGPLYYPTSPDSPVDSVASEIEALKLGEHPTVNNSFSPISSTSFSTSSPLSATSPTNSSPPNSSRSSGSQHQIDLDSIAFMPSTTTTTNNHHSGTNNNSTIHKPSTIMKNICVGTMANTNIPRLPTFTKIATNNNNNTNTNTNNQPNNLIGNNGYSNSIVKTNSLLAAFGSSQNSIEALE